MESSKAPTENGGEKLLTIGEDEEVEDDGKQFGYQHTLMYGTYKEDLSAYAKKEARKLSSELDRERLSKFSDEKRSPAHQAKYKRRYSNNAVVRTCYACTGKLGGDRVYLYLAALGIIMAVLSFIMDWGVKECHRARRWLYEVADSHVVAQYFAWLLPSIALVLFSVALVHVVSPQAIGSGIPEMKTIMRGIILKDYLSFRTLFAKVIGLTASLGSGMPLGKEGPFVHIASIVATLLAKLRIFESIYLSDPKGNEMLAAASAVGVACCFGAPVGGVLMSIEVTSVYFVVRNYWRGFFAAAFAAIFFSLLGVWFQGHATLKPVFKTFLGSELPYEPQELVAFAFIGLIAGLLGASFVYLHRKYILWMRRSKRLNHFLRKNRFIYPLIVCCLISSINYPLGFGQFIAGELTTHQQVVELFSNFSWTKPNLTREESGSGIIGHWETPFNGIFVTLLLFVMTTFFTSILASTLPVPSGNFVPVFKMGAALGRLFGEAMYSGFHGFSFSGAHWTIVPGGYAIVAAAAVAGAVTHTVSVCVIVTEMTGQITHLLPAMLAALVSNAVAGLLQPSIFDSIAIIKKLPYLPDFFSSAAEDAYRVLVKDFMKPDVKYIWYGMNYKELKHILNENTNIPAFPLVENPENCILLGSVDRSCLKRILEKHTGRERRIQTRININDNHVQLVEPRVRSTSRFKVTPVTSIDGNSDIQKVLQPAITSSARPKKSILKKTVSLNPDYVYGEAEEHPVPLPYQTVTGAETKSNNNPSLQSVFSSIADSVSKTVLPPSLRKSVQLPIERIFDLPAKDQLVWEEMELQRKVDFSRCPVDPVPLQLVSETMLLKVHSLFSLLRINRAYVTSTGKLIGVVAMRELRQTIEKCNAGCFEVPGDAEVNEDEERI